MSQQLGHAVPKQQRRLLIVEDEVVVAWALVQTVRELGWQVCATVGTEKAAFEAAVHFKPDVILMDCRLGQGGDGIHAARRIREATDIPIIFCTAYATSLGDQLLLLPRTQTVGKPVRPSSLQKALEAALEVDS
jgi:CheY-like chemotaxis protein